MVVFIVFFYLCIPVVIREHADIHTSMKASEVRQSVQCPVPHELMKNGWGAVVEPSTSSSLHCLDTGRASGACPVSKQNRL